MLTIENLHVSYQKEKEILKGVNLSMESQKIHGLVGLNGAGKTTLLNSIYGFIKPNEGAIHDDNSPLQRKNIAYLEAENYFYPYMTGREYLKLFQSNSSEPFNMESWQQLFSLPLDDVTETYSTGMRKKLALLAVLKTNKPILILDEPFNGLDLESVHILNRIVSLLPSKGKTILITSHIYETLTGCCDAIHYLVEGAIMRSYNREEYPLLQQELHQTIEVRTGDLLKEVL